MRGSVELLCVACIALSVVVVVALYAKPFSNGSTLAVINGCQDASSSINNPSKLTIATACNIAWDMQGPEVHYDPKYFKHQQKTGVKSASGTVRKLRSKLNFENKVVADIGCGGGYMLTLITEATMRLCFEINPAAIAEHAPNLRSVSKWAALADDSVDVMYSHHSFEHHPHPLLSLQCARSKLKPGVGIMHLEVPFEHSGCSLGNHDYGRFYDVPNGAYHLFTWSVRNLGQMMHAAGFANITCKDLRGLPPTAFGDHQTHTMSIWCMGIRPAK